MVTFSCNICAKDFLTKDIFQQHHIVCSSQPGYIKLKELCIQLQAKLEDREKQIQDLRADLQQLSLEAVKRPSLINNTNNSTNNNTHTTNINNLGVFVQAELTDVIEQFPMSKSDMDSGIPGVAKHVGNLLKNKFDKPLYIVSNENKQKFNYKLEDGTVRKDFKSKLIIDSVGPKLSDQATCHFISTRSNYELVAKIKDIENIKSPFLKRALSQFEQQIKDLPSRKIDHPDRVAINKKIEKTNHDLLLLLEDLKTLKTEALGCGIKLDVPIEYYEDDLDKTSQNLHKIRNLKDHSSSFSKTLIETIA
jgi:hypothetical protein